MSDILLSPTASGVYRPASDAYTSTLTVVGAAPQWGDGSDATYTEQECHDANDLDPTKGHFGETSLPRADFPAADVTSINLLGTTVRAQRISGVDSPVFGHQEPKIHCVLYRTSTDTYLAQTNTYADLPVDGSIVTVNVPIDTVASDVAGPLAEGDLSIEVSIKAGFGTIRVFEVWIPATVSDVPPPSTTPLRTPPARLSGRMDGAFLGAGRTDTVGPSSRSGFHPGGYY